MGGFAWVRRRAARVASLAMRTSIDTALSPIPAVTSRMARAHSPPPSEQEKKRKRNDTRVLRAPWPPPTTTPLLLLTPPTRTCHLYAGICIPALLHMPVSPPGVTSASQICAPSRVQPFLAPPSRLPASRTIPSYRDCALSSPPAAACPSSWLPRLGPVCLGTSLPESPFSRAPDWLGGRLPIPPLGFQR